jgi:hypothetical protein
VVKVGTTLYLRKKQAGPFIITLPSGGVVVGGKTLVEAVSYLHQSRDKLSTGEVTDCGGNETVERVMFEAVCIG